jgi:phosphate starvation-inducible PhoH-like protein
MREKSPSLIEERTVLKLSFEDGDSLKTLFGEHDAHLRIIEKKIGARVHVRGNQITISGDEPEVSLVSKLITELYEIAEKGHPIYSTDVELAARMLKHNRSVDLKEVFLETIPIATKRRTISPKSVNQKRYIAAIREYDMVIAIGPAGTGKTYLAMAMAVSALLNKEVERIILARPAVEAGEKLGFLPGDIAEKVNPYLRPLYDALHDMVDFDKACRLIEHGIIEVAPLAFMRGRTLNSSFIILDEAQNTTSEQMKMFLTRMGFDSKVVITGDITQVDLPPEKTSGLIEVQDILKPIPGIKFVYLSGIDVVRHPLVQEIVDAYSKKP